MPTPLRSYLPGLQPGAVSYHPLGVRHVLLCMCDCFDPVDWKTKADALAQIAEWQATFSTFAREFGDSGGVAPRHTFFYPAQRLDNDILAALRDLCAATGSECELRLHRERKNGEDLRRILELAKERLAAHGLLSHDDAGTVRFAFIHPERQGVGIEAIERSAELRALHQSGCMADFTRRSASDPARRANTLCYAPAEPTSSGHCRRVVALRGSQVGANELLQVAGPEVLDWGRRRFGLIPQLDHGELSSSNPPTLRRFRLWMNAQIGVEGRSNWHFVKLHSCSTNPESSRALLGENTRAFYRALAHLSERDGSLRFHFVTARELVNILHAAEAAHSGNPNDFRDFRYRLASSATAIAPLPEPEVGSVPAPTGLFQQRRQSATRSHQEPAWKDAPAKTRAPSGGVLGVLKRDASNP